MRALGFAKIAQTWRALSPRTRWLAYLGGLWILCLTAFLRTPILALDNDLWYHLSHGRYVFEHGQPPNTSYFSFLEPVREWVDYYWFFQVVVFQVFSLAEYPGLIVLRALIFCGFFVALAAYLGHGERDSRRLLWLAVVFGLCLTHSIHKYFMIRPHTVSYLLIPVFLFVIEARPRWAWVLPPLAVLWTNTHGVEYPVLLLICGAYIAQILVERLRTGKIASADDLRMLIALGLSMAAVYLTPHGARLVPVPFTSTQYASSYIDELSRIQPDQLLVFGLTSESFTKQTAFNILLAAGIISLLAAGLRWRAKLAHVLMFAGCLILLSKAIRFTHEVSLLMLPLLKYSSLVPPREVSSRRRLIARVLTALALLAPVLFLFHRLPGGRLLGPAGPYPVAYDNLPLGIASFLDHVDAEGKVMNNPNVGGYLQWALGDRYRIAMDLEIPFLFTDEDMYRLASAFYDRESLRQFLERYDPPFLAPSRASPGFAELIEDHPRYRLVFFDDTGALYADGERFPDIVRRHGILHIDPYRMDRIRFSDLEPSRRAGYLHELERLLEIAPQVSSALQSAAIIHNLEGRHQRALELAERVVEGRPRLARGYAIRGDALVSLDDAAGAIASYRRALRQSQDDTERRSIYRSLSRAHSRADQPREAYEALKRAVGNFNIEASYRDLYNLGVLAAASGEPSDAHKMFLFARLKTPASEPQLRQKIDENLRALKDFAP